MPSPSECRLCGAELADTFVDLGMSPLCESYIPADSLDDVERFYPLHVRQCSSCLLVQLPAYVSGEEIFSHYAYFSSYSDSWVAHAKRYAEGMIGPLGLTSSSLVTEVASNDGYLLQHFLARGIPVLGVEPAANVAEVAESRGIRTVVEFLGPETGRQVADEHGRADLVVGNNVLAHVPDLRGFVAGLRALVKDTGLVTLEFPHLLRLIERRQYDTIYHEHFSYFSLMTAERILAAHGLRLVDVEELWTHGGSLRLFACHDGAPDATSPRVAHLIARERAAGLGELAAYASFAERVKETKRKLLDFLIAAKRSGKSVVGYGAPGKGNTLLNYCGVRTDFLDYTVDRNPYKHGKFLPGTHIPVLPPERVAQTRPDYLLILPWNFKDEIMEQMAFIRGWGGKFVVPIPEVSIHP
jgi:C-methyltransferase-like protein/putative zinc binding protein/methyltransferase family protein